MSFSTVKTMHLDMLETTRSIEGAFSTMQYSTLNEKFNIEQDTDLPPGEYPKIRYIAIGNGGHRNVSGGNGGLQDILQHSVTDAALFNHLPFIMRETNDDLTPSEREKYRLRKVEVHGGKEYYVYYLRKVTLSTTTPQVSTIDTDNGSTTTQEFTPSSSMLSPTPVTMENGKVVETTGKHISVQVPVKIELTQTDIQEIINAAEIIHGDSRYAIISEISIVSAIDLTVNSTQGGNNVNYTEAVGAQCCNFIGANTNLNASNKLVTLNYDLGTTQPLLL